MKQAQSVAQLFKAHLPLLLAAATVMVIGPQAALAQVAVGANGDPSFSLPLKTAPSVGGMVPKLALIYTGGPNRELGQGWALGGVSKIERCAATKAVDGVPGSVQYKNSDKLCLDGQRLIQVDSAGVPLAFPQSGDAAAVASGSYREYRPERDSLTRVRAYGGSGSYGPAYFMVWSADGRLTEYGDSPGAATDAKARHLASGVGVSWAVSRAADSSGNFIQYLYSNYWGYSFTAAYEWTLDEVRYTGTAGQAPSNKLVLTGEGVRSCKCKVNRCSP